MFNKKEILARILCAFHVEKLVLFFRSYLVHDLKIITYHRVCETDALNDQELVSANIQSFEKQMLHIKKHHNAISFSELFALLESDSRLPRNAVIVTFDDGFFDNYLNAFPILKKHKILATMFISTGYIGEDNTFWFNFLSRMIKVSTGKSFTIDSKIFDITDSIENKENLLITLLSLLMKKTNKERLSIIESLTEQLSYTDNCDELALPMSWDNIVEMNNDGIEFGSHSVTHPILSQLNDDELYYEITESKNQLVNQLGVAIKTIAYPVGGEDTYNDKVIDMSERAGYLFGASYISGVNYIRTLDRFQLKRMHIERYVSFELFKCMLVLPELFAK